MRLDDVDDLIGSSSMQLPRQLMCVQFVFRSDSERKPLQWLYSAAFLPILVAL